jgi:hypothetical protein
MATTVSGNTSSTSFKSHLESIKTEGGFNENTQKVIQGVFDKMAAPDFKGKVEIDGTKFKLSKSDYIALANITSQVLQTHHMGKEDVDNLNTSLGEAVAAIRSKHVQGYFTEAQTHAGFRQNALQMNSSSDLPVIYKMHIENLIEVEKTRKEKLEKTIVKKRVLAGVALGTAVTAVTASAVAIGVAGLFTGGTAAMIGAPILLVAVPVVFVAGGGWIGRLIKKSKDKLKQTKNTLEELESVNNLIDSEKFKKFQQDNPLPQEKQGIFKEYVDLFNKTEQLEKVLFSHTHEALTNDIKNLREKLGLPITK